MKYWSMGSQRLATTEPIVSMPIERIVDGHCFARAETRGSAGIVSARFASTRSHAAWTTNPSDVPRTSGVIDVLLRAASTKTNRPMAGTHSSNVLMCLPEACRRDDEMQIVNVSTPTGVMLMIIRRHMSRVDSARLPAITSAR